MNHPIEAAKFDLQTPHQVAGQNVRHESAHLHVTGTAPYTDDVPELAGTLHCALGLSPVAHGRPRPRRRLLLLLFLITGGRLLMRPPC